MSVNRPSCETFAITVNFSILAPSCDMHARIADAKEGPMAGYILL